MSHTQGFHQHSIIHRWVVIIGCIALAVPLVGYVINGSFMRYSGDDYCYGDVLTRMGFWKAQLNSYTQPQAYNGNRYSLTFFSDVNGLLGPLTSAMLPGLAIITWISGVVFVVHWASRLARIVLFTIEKVLLAEILVFFTLYLAPNLPQILYWRSGMLPYLAPLISNTFLIGLLLRESQNKTVIHVAIWPIIGLGFLSGGFSEAVTSVQIGYLILFIAGLLIVKRVQYEWSSRPLKLVGAALVSSLIAMILLGISPSNSERLLKSVRPDFHTFISLSLHSAKDFIVESITGQPVPIIVLLVISMAISWMLFSRIGRPIRISKPQLALYVILLPLLTYALIVLCVIPSVYAQSAYPESRALISARLIMIIAIMTAGGMLSLIIHVLLSSSTETHSYLQLSVLVLLGIIWIYPIYAARNIYVDIPRYQRWAVFWDERDEEIRKAKQNNVMDVEVIKIDHIIPSVGDLSDDTGYWYNLCAAGYYGIHSISANQPGWEYSQP